jgi:CHAD domain-containing protein
MGAGGGKRERETARPVPVAALLARYQQELFRQWPRALVGDDEAIHQLRVLGRRLRVGLQLLEGATAPRVLRRARRLLGRLGRAAGRARDLSVVLEFFDARRTAIVPSPPTITSLRRRLAGAKRRAKDAMRETLLDLDVAGLRALMRKILAVPGQRADESGLLLPARAQAEAAAFLTELPQARRFQVEVLHDLRRRARRLRYLAEIDGAVLGRDAGAAGCFKKVQDGLGTIRDLWMLVDWYHTQAASPAYARDVACVDTARRLFRSAGRELASLHREWHAEPTVALIRQGMARLGVGLRLQTTTNRKGAAGRRRRRGFTLRGDSGR